jgi:hypothetical protein
MIKCSYVNARTPYQTTVVMAGLSLEPRLSPKQIHVCLVVEKVALGQILLPSISGFPCQYHSTNATY